MPERVAMIDSVVIRLQPGQFKVLDDKYFDGISSNKQDGKFSMTSAYVNRQAQIIKKQGFYFPRVTLPQSRGKRPSEKETPAQTLEIQTSMPKEMWGTNIFEVDCEDKETFYFKLKEDLEKIHVRTTTNDLGKGVLKRVDFSKLIRPPVYLGEARQVLRLLAHCNHKPGSDLTVKEFRDVSEGLLLKFWSKPQGYALYDKVGDIIAHGYTKQEQDIVKAYHEGKIPRRIIKFERSFQLKQTLDSVLRQYIPGKSKDFTLGDIMAKKEISKAILLDSFDKVFSPTTIALVTLSEMDENRLEEYLLKQNLGLKKHSLLYYLVRMTTKIGVAAMWGQLDERTKGSSYDRYRKEIALVMAELGPMPSNIPPLITYLRNEHEKFDLFRRHVLPQKLY